MKRYCTAVGFGLWLAAGASAQQPGAALEFYGYARGGISAPQLAFLRQGGRIIIAAEGDLFEDTYKLLRIGADSVVIEHVSDKHRQTLPLMAPNATNGSASAEPAANAVQPGNLRGSRRPARAAADTQR